MNKKLQEFNIKYPNYEIVNYKNNYSTFYFYDENKILHKKDNLYRALNFKIGVESAVNKILYIQNILNKLDKEYILIYYGGMKYNSIVKYENFTYNVILYDLIQGHDVSNIKCLDLIKSNISKSKKCGFSKSKFLSLYKNKVVSLYLIEVFNKNESFYKIGLTYKKINQRFSGISKFKYKIKIIDNLLINGENAYDFEKQLKNNCKKYKYIPENKYPGYTESFTKEIKQIYEQFKREKSENY